MLLKTGAYAFRQFGNEENAYKKWNGCTARF